MPTHTRIEGVFPSAALSSSPAAIMRRNGRSFWFASRLLPHQVAADAAELYAFCRTLDDLADQSPTPQTVQRLQALAADLARGVAYDDCAIGLLALAQRHALPLEAAAHLVSTFVEDGSTSLHLQTEANLVRYCFGVAGTVGLMMSPLLGVRNKQANLYAADLGIAMQMTNIARDVMEDARNGRRYLPGDWLDNVTPQQITDDPSCRPLVSQAIDRLLIFAERYYAAAARGFGFIPYRSRVAIQVSAAIYREIGMALRAEGLHWWGARTVVPTSRKILLAGRVLAGVAYTHPTPDEAELASLYRPFIHMPGAA